MDRDTIDLMLERIDELEAECQELRRQQLEKAKEITYLRNSLGLIKEQRIAGGHLGGKDKR